MFTSGYKIIKPNSLQELKKALRNSRNDLWGMVVFPNQLTSMQAMAYIAVAEKGLHKADYNPW